MAVRPCMGTAQSRCTNYALPGESRCQHCLLLNRPLVTGARGTSGSWRKLRRAVLKRDDYRCVGCGVTDQAERARHGKGLAVHHRDLNPENDSLENLESICRLCHRAKHAHISGKGHSGRLSRFALPPTKR